MSVYHGKLIELIDIETNAEQSFLRVKLSFEQDTELIWKVTNNTAESLKEITTSDQHYKHRLSFYSSWDPIRKCYVSFLTRTYRDQSDKVYFACSEEYVKALHEIKLIQKTEDIENIACLSFNQLESVELEQAPKQDVSKPKKYKHKMTWAAVALVGIISTILFGYSSQALKNLSDEKPTANAETTNSELNTKQDIKRKHPITSSTEVTPSEQSKSSIPSVELIDALTYSIPEGSVALTFDDGPSKFSKEIVDILDDFQVGGTFFFIGQNVKKHPIYVKYVNSEGFSIGTHSTNHVHVSSLSYEQQENELIQTIQLIEDITNEEVDLFRPPYGDMNQLTIDLINEHQGKMVLWNNDPKDWKSNDPKDIVSSVQGTKTSGSIILLHESEAVIEALPQIIKYLQSKGLQIVNLT
ncbi:polysaccharide deacetylase family protein [Virgibacillus salinus]|uniref:Peptidoglycan/xylan/chitin deacetylase, PgdA/CDA1 family n=1 Tax=Virgibacillus salinus TaxID=553311 RepID=A0A1H0XXE7_9BACI|nr:polysaccharide deacetylase family protein [Virgibacillus salinus]SDQ07590.1 Peptidoglycan/xylan/chitin deacetylase, PgdA/CDA1 family [Virgibacillus salinus]